MLERNDIDGVMIATGDFQHAKLCMEVVQAGKDCYVEKPFANVLAEAKATRKVVKDSKQVVQMGTQHRSQPYPLAIRDVIRSGRIGDIAKITQEWDVNQQRWRYIRVNDDGQNPTLLKEEDTDWKRWLLGKPVPADVSVAGFNDTEAAVMTPLLTSVAEYPEELGKHLAEFALRRAQEPDRPPQRLTVPTRVVVRQSTRPIKLDGPERMESTVAASLYPNV